MNDEKGKAFFIKTSRISLQNPLEMGIYVPKSCLQGFETNNLSLFVSKLC